MDNTAYHRAWYPEAFAAGSLCAAIQAAAAEQELSVTVTSAYVHPWSLYSAEVRSILPGRERLAVGCSFSERRWWIDGGEDDQRLSGHTSDLRALARIEVSAEAARRFVTRMSGHIAEGHLRA